MKLDDIKQITVVGAGLMGHAIALEFALAGYDVGLYSRTPESLRRGLENVDASLGQLVEVGKTSATQAKTAATRIHGYDELDQASKSADLVIESVYEDLALKREVFKELDRLCPERTILASNTSGFMPSSFTGQIRRRDRALVVHYVNPPHLVPLVEVVPTPQTSEATVERVTDLLTGIGKRPIVIRKEVPGFVLNRLQMALLREALWLVDNKVVEAPDVDLALRSSIGRRWAVAGIFEILEIAGWDLVFNIASGLLPHLSESSDVPQVLKEKVERGEFGVKTGKGFYDWTPESAAALKARIAQALIEIDGWSQDGEGEQRV
jgi:3-hydroxybutyryl-CoA dehydrogenase